MGHRMRIPFIINLFRSPITRISLFIFVVATLLYARAIPYGYAWDDAIVITENARVQQGMTGLGSHWVKHQSEKLQDKYGFRPVTMTSFAIEYGIFGPNPHVSHLVNALLYGLLCTLIFGLLLHLMPDAAPWFAAIITLLYAMHPLHVEAVANIKSRDEILSFGFGIAGLLMLLRGYARSHWGLLAGAWVAFLLAYLSKESALVVLGMAAAAVVAQPGAWRKKIAVLLPLPAIALAMGLILWWSSGSTVDATATDGAGIVQESLRLGNPMFGEPNQSQFIPTGFGVMLLYLKEFLWPWPLVYYAGFDQVPLFSWADPSVWISVSLWGIWCGLGVHAWRRDRLPMLAFCFFGSFMLIYGHFLRPLADLMADRFMLAPSLGLCMMLAWVIRKLLNSKYLTSPNTAISPTASLREFAQRQRFFVGSMALLGLVWAYRSWDRIPAWRDNLSLFATDIPHLDACARCHGHYAGALLQQFQTSGGTAQQAAQIEAEYRRAIALSPLVYTARIELAQFLYNQRRYADGTKVMEACHAQFPTEPRPLYFLGYGEYFQGHYPEAIAHLKSSWHDTPQREDAPYFLAWAYFYNGEVAAAIDLVRTCLVRYPQNDQFPDALSDFLFATDQVAEGFRVLHGGIARFHSKVLYAKIIQRYTESKQLERAEIYRTEARLQGIQL